MKLLLFYLNRTPLMNAARGFLLFILCLSSIPSFSQDTTYFDKDGNKVANLTLADHYEIVQHLSTATNQVIDKTYYASGQIREVIHYSDYKKKIINGKRKEYYRNGQIKQDIDVKNGNFDGLILTYWKNGQAKRIDHFKNGNFIKGQCFSKEGKKVAHFDYERMPEFRGGNRGLLRYLSRKIIYPKKARRKGVEGTVVVQFVVEKDGTTSNIRVTQSVGESLDKEAVRVVKSMPRWKPGVQDGDLVSVQFSLPIRFRLTH